MTYRELHTTLAQKFGGSVTWMDLHPVLFEVCGGKVQGLKALHGLLACGALRPRKAATPCYRIATVPDAGMAVAQ